MLYIILYHLISILSVSILINTSTNKINYSQLQNITRLKHFLIKEAKVSEKEIYTFSNEINFSIFDGKSEFLPINLQEILCLLKGTHPFVFLHEKFNKNENVFIYLTGHGSVEFLKVHDKTYLFPNHIIKSLKELCKKVNSVFFVLDTCHAEAILENSCYNLNEENLCIFITSLKDEESQGINLDPIKGVYTIDEFVYSLTKEKIGNKKIQEIFKNLKGTSTFKFYFIGEKFDLK